ncbi:CYTH domain-containing protein [Acetobacteroides hydrogenigenes]|uniref:Adenylate cyclase n=1 Tax=Acetobacteroides hydrogenigenes TaxID=979970 RepID=A0A4R2EF87_9BACT|nr:CYTH domain-containing protein [Acetobacteroides hydrogenigenes]TCN62709.1 adenylate cyclase [Acetobacteroides hydrogenigenes]
MALEIERKFLVKSEDYKKLARGHYRIVQGYLSSNPERTVRVRVKGEKGYLTIKGIANNSGLSRFEWEKEIAVADADELLKICEPGVIDKIRYEVNLGSHTYEVDEFSGDNRGLVIAEIELSDENEAFEKPNWLGEEVSGDERYYNSMLSLKPFCRW